MNQDTNQNNANVMNNEMGMGQQVANGMVNNQPQVNGVPEMNVVSQPQVTGIPEANVMPQPQVNSVPESNMVAQPQVNSVPEMNTINSVQPSVSTEVNGVQNVPSADVNNYQQPINNQNASGGNNHSKKSNKVLVLALVLLVCFICVGAVVGYFLATNIIQSDSKLIQGKWDCGEGVEINIDSKNFNLSAGSDTSVNATYKVTKSETQGSVKKITFEATATKRIIDGEEYTDAISNEYQIAIDSNNTNEFAMIDTKTYSMVTCDKVK